MKIASLVDAFDATGRVRRFLVHTGQHYDVAMNERLFRDLGLHIDASSDYEVERAIRAGFRPEQVQLTSQMPSRWAIWTVTATWTWR